MTFRKPKRTVSRVFLHCSASDNPAHDNVETMDRWHKQRGWTGVGYSFFIRKSGRIEIGRDIEKTPAAQRGHNTGTIAICCHGLKRQNFTQAQMLALKGLCDELSDAYNGKVTFHGHKEVAAKACPVFDYKAVLGLDRYGRMVRNSNVHTSAPNPRGEHPILRQGSIGPSVEDLQELLNIKVDGHFGPKTKKAVKAFQATNGLTQDGVAGKLTWATLQS